jgi:hypothetical protein
LKFYNHFNVKFSLKLYVFDAATDTFNDVAVDAVVDATEKHKICGQQRAVNLGLLKTIQRHLQPRKYD